MAMNREDFASFVATTLDDVVRLAEAQCGKPLPRRLAFQWLGRSHPVVTDNIVEHIVARVFVDEEHIYPCVDIGVGDLLDDGTVLIVGNVAGYAPRPFGPNWKGKPGPFIHIVGGPFLNRIAGKMVTWSPDKPFAFVTQDMPKPQ